MNLYALEKLSGSLLIISLYLTTILYYGFWLDIFFYHRQIAGILFKADLALFALILPYLLYKMNQYIFEIKTGKWNGLKNFAFSQIKLIVVTFAIGLVFELLKTVFRKLRPLSITD